MIQHPRHIRFSPAGPALLNQAVLGLLYKLHAKCHGFMLFTAAALLYVLSSAAFAGAATTSLISGAKSAVVSIEATRGLFFSANPMAQGTGFYVAPNRLLTAWHVVQSAKKVTITNSAGEQSSAEVIDSWPERDLALVEVVKPGAVTWLRLSDQLPIEGETVVAMGYPFGFGLFSSEGIVSSKVDRPKGESIDLFATDTVVNPGMSGGPLINSKGEVLGLLSRIYSSTGSFAGMTFAYPSRLISQLIDRSDSQSVN